MENIQKYLKHHYLIDIEEDHEDVQHLKNKVFTSSLYTDAKKYLNYGTVQRYKKLINSCGNNRRKVLNKLILNLGKSIYKRIGT